MYLICLFIDLCNHTNKLAVGFETQITTLKYLYVTSDILKEYNTDCSILYCNTYTLYVQFTLEIPIDLFVVQNTHQNLMVKTKSWEK